METGVFGLNAKVTHTPAETARFARLAEELGYGSWWVGEHVVLPSPRTPDTPANPADPFVDPLVHLAYVAALTERIELGTGIVILPQRQPVLLAKQVASLDVLSSGRVLLGVGAGYLEPELNAMGVRLSERGARTDEYLDAMRSLWLDENPAFNGKYVSFAGVDAHPRPVREPRVFVGGHSPAAYRRAVTRGHGWFGTGGSPRELERSLAGLAKAASEVDRPERLGKLEITYMPMPEPGRSRDYAELGVDRLLVYPLPLEDPAEVTAFLEKYA